MMSKCHCTIPLCYERKDSLMNNILIIFGSFICLICLLIIIFPQYYRSVVQSITVTTSLRLTSFVVRVLLGSVILFVADTTNSPLTIQIIGILLIMSGVAALLMSNAMIQKLIDWILRWETNSIRIGAVIGIFFGAFLIYADF